MSLPASVRDGHVRFEDINVGDQLPELSQVPTRLQVFRYSAVTWNSHRIHFDPDYAAAEGYPDVLVQSYLHGAFLTRLCTDWMGTAARLRRLTVSVRRFAVPGDVLVCAGEIVAVDRDERLVHLDLKEVRQSDDEVCATASAVVALP